MREGDKEFYSTVEQCKRILETLERSNAPFKEDIRKLIRYVEVLDKNQKQLIKGLLRKQRMLDRWIKAGDKLLKILTTEQLIEFEDFLEEMNNATDRTHSDAGN